MRAVFVHDQEAAVEGIRSGDRLEAMDSEYGRNELLVDFLRELGVWDLLTSMKSTKRPNGKAQPALNGSLILFDLAHLGVLERSEPILRDGLLMTEVGFTLKELKQAAGRDRGVVHRDTLRNHLQRIEPGESRCTLYRCVKLMRSKKLIRGKVFAADGLKIRVYGKTYEGSGQVWDREQREMVRGYKLVILMNLTPGREYVVGCALGPIQADERALLREILTGLEEHGIVPEELIDLLVLDRGYWGADFLSELRSRYHIHYLTLVPGNVALHEDVVLRAREGDLPTGEVRLDKNGEGVALTVGYLPDFAVQNERGKQVLRCNVIYGRTCRQDKPLDLVLVTSHGEYKPQKYIQLYWRRWAMENEGVRHLNQVWGIKRPVGRKLNAIFAHIVMLLCLSNAVRAFEARYPQEQEATREKMRRRGQRSYLLDRGCVVFLPDRRIYAVMSSARFADLVKERTLDKLQRLVQSGVSLEDAIAEVKREL
jgi:hypothetical protein